jgi:hypothetical protein
VDEGLEGPTVQLIAREAIAEIGHGAEGTILPAAFNQEPDRPLSQIANGRQAKKNAVGHGCEILI